MSARDNGLSAGSYVFLTSVAPPVAPELLAELRDEGIAAYTVENDPEERLYVDRVSAPYAQVLVRRRLAGSEVSDEEEAWRAIVAGYDQGVDDTERRWPAAEDVASESRGESVDTRTTGRDAKPAPTEVGYYAAEDEEEHYVPPPPPPLPREDMPTKAAFAGIALALGSLCLMVAFDWARQWWIVLLTVAVLVGGVVTHVLRISDPRNPGSDDGAQV